MKTKTKVLIYWDYRRKDLLLPFLKLKEEIDFVFIFLRYKEEDLTGNPSFKTIYWSNYKSGFQLIKNIQPDAVIFIELTNLYALALNFAAKSKSIPTYWLDHGLKLDLNFYIRTIKTEKETRKHEQKIITSFTDKLHTLTFYFKSIRINKIAQATQAAKLFYSIYNAQTFKAFINNKFSFRRPFKYLLFSKQNFPFYASRDGAEEKDVIYFGNPYFDEWLLMTEKQSQENYFLLLDDGVLEVFGVSMEQKRNFICRLNNYALSKKVKLYIKLHPMDYYKDDIYINPNIVYLRDVSITEVIQKATLSFGISSSIVFPLIPHGKIIIFDFQNDIQKLMKEYGVKMLPYDTFSNKDLETYRPFENPHKQIEFVENFLYKQDDKATERLKRILVGTYEVS